jgi:pimeloyl-ACP methyl ester carboxylesterase
MTAAPDLDPGRFALHRFDGRGFDLAYVREGSGGVPLVLLHGWPETKRIFWRVIEPLARAGFEVIAPDLRGFGDSDVAPDGFHDTAAAMRDVEALLGHLGHDRVVVSGHDFGGPVAQLLAAVRPDLVGRMVIANSPLPGDNRAVREAPGRSGAAVDYFIRQGTDPDGLAAELDSPDRRRRYIATFYTSRFWAHPGTFDADAVAFHTEPFADGARLRAGFGPYQSVFDPSARSEPVRLAPNPDVPVLVLYGPSDHVILEGFDRRAAEVFPAHVGPFLLRDCGHFVPWEAPHAFVTATTSFCGDLLALARHRPGSSGEGAS